MEWNERRWSENLNRFVEHVNTYGTYSCSPKVDKKLNSWIDNQRVLYRNGCLSEERINQLREVGFCFSDNDAWFKEAYNKLVEYKDQVGNLDIRSKDPLGPLVDTLRNKHKANKLNEEQIDQLTNLGFIFNFYEDYWTKMYNKLRETLESGSKVRDQRLNEWMARQRSKFRNGSLRYDRQVMLEELGVNLNYYVPSRGKFKYPENDKNIKADNMKFNNE